MTERKAMPRAEVFRILHSIGAAVLAGEPAPSIKASTDYMRLEDVNDAAHAFARIVAKELENVPSAFPNDMELQEAIRHKLDTVMADTALAMKEAVAKLGRQAS